MIRNLFFDIYNVVVGFDKKKQIKLNYLNEDDLQFISEMFGRGLWNDCDLGKYYGKSELIGDLINVYPERETQIRKIFSRPWSTYMKPYEPVYKHFKELSTKYNLYFLSNISQEEFDFVLSQPWSQYFTGHYCSFEAHCMKPDIEIYKGILNKYDLKAEECLFIDDLEENLKAAETIGIKAKKYDLKTDDFEQIKKSLM